MRKLNIIAVCALMVMLMACSKEKVLMALPEGSISFDLPTSSDLVEVAVPILQDGTSVIEIKAALNDSQSSDNHVVTFATDTTKIVDYRAKYGAATLLPATCYLFFKPQVVLPAGASKSEVAQLNIVQQTRLTELTTYVLPVVIRSVDGKAEGTATNRVVYYVIKTGKGYVSRTGWTVTTTSVNGTFVANNLIDANNTTTYWTSNLTQTMPQAATINFNRDIAFTSVAYYLPSALAYPKNGGYPTSIKIETSMNGTTWVDKGTFAGNIVKDMQIIEIGATTARYLRFTSLASVKYISGANLYEAIFISGIGLVPAP